MNNQEKAIKIAEELNNDNYTELSIPILGGFTIEKTDHPNIVFIAKNKDNFMEQFLRDTKLEENEKFDTHLQHVLIETKNAMKENNIKNPEKNLLFYKTIGKYKLYIQNNILDNIIVKQMNTYLVDSNNVFYQISIITPPMLLDPPMTIKQDTNLNESLFEMMKTIVTNIK